MIQHRILSAPLQATGFALLTLIAGTALAESRGTTPGYAADSTGNIVTSGTGDCVHTGSWSKDKATIVGCDGYVLDAQVKIIKGEGLDAVSMISFPQAELFAFDKAELSEGGKTYIQDHRDELGGDLAEVYSVTVIGYTDTTGDANYNMGLSKRRAEAVSGYLATIGVPADKTTRLKAAPRTGVWKSSSWRNRAPWTRSFSPVLPCLSAAVANCQRKALNFWRRTAVTHVNNSSAPPISKLSVTLMTLVITTITRNFPSNVHRQWRTT